MFNRCKHQWDVLTERREPSSFLHALQEGVKISHPTEDSCRDTYIFIASCKKCGKVMKVIEKV